MAMTGTVLKRSDFNGKNGSKFELVLTYEYVQNATAKTTTFTYRNYFVSKDYYSGSGNTATGYINGSNVGTTTSISAGEQKLMGSKKVVVNHNANGTFPETSYSASIDTPWTIGDASVSGKFSAGAFPAFATTSIIRYYANGGINSPVSQQKAAGTAINLTTDTPTKLSTTGSPYTITFNGNNGTADIASMTSNLITNYNFSKWNTNAAGTGTNYNSGASYNTDADLDLYAQYTTGTTQRESVVLPSASRTGYRCLGWSTSASATTPVLSPYTPSGNVTLYAIWELVNDQIKTKNGSSWVSTPVVKTKNGNNWDYISNYVKTSW